MLAVAEATELPELLDADLKQLPSQRPWTCIVLLLHMLNVRILALGVPYPNHIIRFAACTYLLKLFVEVSSVSASLMLACNDTSQWSWCRIVQLPQATSSTIRAASELPGQPHAALRHSNSPPPTINKKATSQQGLPLVTHHPMP